MMSGALGMLHQRDLLVGYERTLSSCAFGNGSALAAYDPTAIKLTIYGGYNSGLHRQGSRSIPSGLDLYSLVTNSKLNGL